MPWHDPPKGASGRLTLQYLSSYSTAHSISSSTTRLSSLLRVPAAVWSNDGCGDGQLVHEYGAYNIKLSRVHEGSGFRVQRFLQKVADGEKVKVAVIGGSVSNGHGTDENGNKWQYGAIKQTWHTFVSSWINGTFGEQEFLNGAMGATDASFFRFCWSERIHLSERAPDLVFIELDVNNANTNEARDYTEEMLRSILQLPTKPAVIFVGSMGINSGWGPLTNGGDAHAALSAWYDIPQISIRNTLLPAAFRNTSLALPYFNNDEAHIAAPVHRYLGDMVVAYLQQQKCAMARDRLDRLHAPANWLWPDASSLGEVPLRAMTDGWESQNVHHASAAPTCALAGFSLAPVAQDGTWQPWSWLATKHYLVNSEAGKRIEFDVEVPKDGEGIIGVGYLRSKGYKLGKLVCDVEGQQAVLDGHWDRGVSLTEITPVARGLAAGTYRLVCTTAVGQEENFTAFRIASVVAA
ncbi:hypothetical protein JCM8097_004399 [Rhodosporidiobolus ruineniae]